MKVKRYEAEDIKQALQKVRAELGNEAFILSTRRIEKNNGLSGLFSKPGIEVTAIANKDSSKVQQVKPPANRYYPLTEDNNDQTNLEKDFFDNNFYYELQEIKSLLKTVIESDKVQQERCD